MERNAPLLVGQKKDLNRVLESHSHLTARLDEVGTENSHLRYALTHYTYCGCHFLHAGIIVNYGLYECLYGPAINLFIF